MPTTDELGRSAARGGAVTMAGQAVRIAVQLLGLVILARLLSPHDYGLMAMMLVIVTLAEIVRDFGLTQAAVHAPNLSIAQRDNLFWVNTALGATLTISVALSAPLIAMIFGAPELVDIARWTSLVFLLNGMSTQYRASLNREMQFGRLAAIDVLASAVGLIAATLAAIAGLGYWALVIQQLTFAPIALIVAGIAAGWLPRWIRREGDIRSFISYGKNLLGTQIINNVYRNVDVLIIGAKFGTSATGFYDRAFQILMLPLNQLNAPATKVALPTLSKLREQPDKFNNFIIVGQSAMVHVLFSVFAFIAVATDPLVSIALGEKWLPAASILKILCIAGCAQAASYASYWVFLARGLTSQNLKYALATRPIMMVIIIIGSLWGVHGVAFAYALGLVLSWPLAILWLRRVTEIPAKRMLLNGAVAFLGWGSVYALVAVFDIFITDWNSVPRLAALSVAFVLATSLTWAVFPSFRRDINGLKRVVHLLRR